MKRRSDKKRRSKKRAARGSRVVVRRLSRQLGARTPGEQIAAAKRAPHRLAEI